MVAIVAAANAKSDVNFLDIIMLQVGASALVNRYSRIVPNANVAALQSLGWAVRSTPNWPLDSQYTQMVWTQKTAPPTTL
jgi:hypothetical protein